MVKQITRVIPVSFSLERKAQVQRKPIRSENGSNDGFDPIPAEYQHESTRGKRLPGWENLHVIKLAQHVGIGPQHARQVLTGRTGGRVALLQSIAETLEIHIDVLVRRIEHARKLDEARRSGLGRDGSGKGPRETVAGRSGSEKRLVSYLIPYDNNNQR